MLDPNDSRAKSAQITKAKIDEIKFFLEFCTLTFIIPLEVPHDANILPGRFLLATKSIEDGKINFKAQYIIDGYRDKMKYFMVRNAEALHPKCMIFNLALSTEKNLKYGQLT